MRVNSICTLMIGMRTFSPCLSMDARIKGKREREKREAMYIACIYIFYDHQQLCRQKNGGTK